MFAYWVPIADCEVDETSESADGESVDFLHTPNAKPAQDATSLDPDIGAHDDQVQDEELQEATILDADSDLCVQMANNFITECRANAKPVVLQSLNLKPGSCSWREFHPASVKQTGGALVMRVGVAFPLTAQSAKQWSFGVHRSLDACHAAGFCHCDIRPSNVVDFEDDGIQLIDHDCAVLIGRSVTFAGGGQYEMRPLSLHSYGPSSKVKKWTQKHDSEMVTSCVINTLSK